jgi:hypothetical protein
LPRRLAPAASVVLLLGLFVYLFWVPLRPAAWGGPRGAGPFEDGELPAAGRFARTVRLPLEQFATWRSPDHPLEATAEALAGFHALFAAARFAVLWLLLWRLGGRGWLATLGVLAAALPMIVGGSRQDEADIGLLLFVVLMAASTPPRIPWLVAVVGLPALFAVWANAHASAVVGLAWLGVVAVGWAVEWWNGWRAGIVVRPAGRRLLVAVVLCAGATCLNPDGPTLFADAFRVTKNPNLHSLPEWQPLNFSAGAGMPWVYFATVAALFAAQLASRRVLGLLSLLVLLTFGFWPVIQQRGLAYWWLIAPWLVVPLVGEIVRRLRDPVPGAPSEGDGEGTGSPSPSLGAPGSGSPGVRRVAIVVAFIALASTPFVRWLVTGQPRELGKIVADDTPWRVARELTAGEDDTGRYLPELRETVRAAYPKGRYRGAILTGEVQGDFLAWVLDGDNDQPVMNYSRPEALDRGHWGEVHGALDGSSDWWETLGRHQVNLVVIDPRRWTKLAERLRDSPAWRIVEDAPALLTAVRREPKLPAELQH